MSENDRRIIKKIAPKHRKPIMADLGRIRDTIRQRRLDLGLTQEELAEKLGIGATTLQFIEQLRRYPSLPILLYICHVLRISIHLKPQGRTSL
jgi:transcriptional regulator with XRE-family HTH domain